MRITLHVLTRLRLPAKARSRAGGVSAFTLLELMIVIGIMGMILTIGMPSFLNMLSKDAMRQAVSDVMEICSEARAQAIIKGVPSELCFNVHDRIFSITTLAAPAQTPNPASEFADPSPQAAPTASGRSNLTKHLSEDLDIEMLSVNFVEKKDEDEARVRFYPNGTCDEFTIVLQWPAKQLYRKITLDIITSLPDVEVIK
jgi:prepilin-type N-terminal cleavage/methylation domain-containing protein